MKRLVNYNSKHSYSKKELKERKEKMLKGDECNGYLRVTLSKNGKNKHYRVHRLVAQAFIPNPDNKPQINHKDNDRKNNNVENLEWCTAIYNLYYRNNWRYEEEMEKTEDITTFLLRIDKNLYKQLKKIAKEQDRSVNWLINQFIKLNLERGK